MPSERTAPCWPGGDSFHGAVGPTDQDPLPWEEANVLLENARYVDAGVYHGRRH